ncbi:ribosomal protein L9 [Orientia chuto str. Dubai]|uniref:Large ribosomal subunit protein bL9 n=1 Tax=Orientia chuto str. Dubai TaxID=1359168 RepID=A0A0F3MIU0_9RICK|nr:50S ribosomal protein L9 [Candidatus Orientia mediorientalis]KJV55397.1 ribosomal protein L9 [Orientia chuto str. Dubai]
MKLILIKPVKKLGKIMDIVDVANGFGRNYLLPRNYAIRATNANLEVVKSTMQQLNEKNQKGVAIAQEIMRKIDKSFITFICQTSDDGRLFGSVNAKAIIKKLQITSDIKVHIDIKPIKTVGIHEVEVSLHAEVNCKIFVNVARSNTEAQEYLKKFNAMQQVNESTEEHNVVL